jgi:hypothetical protein
VTTPWNPFAVLGLPAGPGDVTDEDVRRAWRRIAAATHPDRSDGGDPAAYAGAARAYAVLRTAWGRGEARADLHDTAAPVSVPVAYPPAPDPAPVPAWRAAGRAAWRHVRLLPARVRHGRPGRLALRVLAAAVLAFVAWRACPGTPAATGTAVLLATWLVLAGRNDLAPLPGR